MQKQNGKSTKRRQEITVPMLRVKKGAGLKDIYAAARRSFSAADLQKYTDVEKGVPLERIIEEMEVIQSEETRRQRNRKKNA